MASLYIVVLECAACESFSFSSYTPTLHILFTLYPYTYIYYTFEYSLFTSTTLLPHRLLDPSFYLLPLLGSKFPLETAIGMNGRVWINTDSPKNTIIAVRCIEFADPDGNRGTQGRGRDEGEVKKFLGSLLDS